jgi:hypothetical protein
MEHLSLAANGLQYESGVHAQAVFLQHPRLQRIDLRYNKSTKLGLLKVGPGQQMHKINFRRLGTSWAFAGLCLVSSMSCLTCSTSQNSSSIRCLHSTSSVACCRRREPRATLRRRRYRTIAQPPWRRLTAANPTPLQHAETSRQQHVLPAISNLPPRV